MKYLFVFGRNPELSLLELVCYFKARKTNFSVIALLDQAMVVEFPNKLNADCIVKELAGTVKISRVLFSCNGSELKEKIEKGAFYHGTKNKITYFVELFGAEESTKNFFKKAFRLQRLKAVHKMLAPHTIALKKREHVDLAVAKAGQDYFVAETIACSNPHSFKERDLGRPFPEAEIMSSIRLSRILVNLSCKKPPAIILDPFSGVGTVLQEAILSGFNAKGLELSYERVSKCRKNLEWAKQEFNLNTDFEVKQGNAENLSKYFGKKINAIVTEPELGPLLKRLPTEKEAMETITALQQLYNSFFSEASKVLEKDSVIVIVIPRLKTRKGKKVCIDMDSTTLKKGFKILNPAKEISEKAGVPLLYSEPWHKIERLIFILKKI